MIDRVRKILVRVNRPTVFGSYYNSVRTRGNSYGPTIDEARKDFIEIARRYSHD